MFDTEVLSPYALKITAPEKLKAEDFGQLAPQVDAIIAQHGKIRLLIDASHLHGWEDLGAFEKHAMFIRDHQDKVDRIAVIAPHEWQHWLISMMRMFVHPHIKAYDTGHVPQAQLWITS